MDLFLGSFAERNLSAFGDEALRQYLEILETPDPDLYDWITHRCEPPANRITPVLELLLRHDFTEKQ